MNRAVSLILQICLCQTICQKSNLQFLEDQEIGTQIHAENADLINITTKIGVNLR